MSVFEQTVTVSKRDTRNLDYWLTDNSDKSERLYEELTYTKTAVFDDNFQMDIKCCGSNDDTAWTEAVLFDSDGCECSFTEASDEFFGDWELKWGDNVYRVHVVKETK